MAKSRGGGLKISLRKKHNKLFSTESAYSINVSNTAFGNVGNVLDCYVSKMVTQRVVDLFQVIQVYDDERESVAESLKTIDFLGQLFLEISTIEQSSHRISDSLLLNLGEQLGV